MIRGRSRNAAIPRRGISFSGMDVNSARPSANGTWATTAEISGCRAATTITCPPENDVPQRAIREGSIVARLLTCAKAASQS